MTTFKKAPVAISVRLETEWGGVVATGRVPSFLTGPPCVLTWGSRTFRFDSEDPVGEKPHLVYRECSAVEVIDIDTPAR